MSGSVQTRTSERERACEHGKTKTRADYRGRGKGSRAYKTASPTAASGSACDACRCEGGRGPCGGCGGAGANRCRSHWAGRGRGRGRGRRRRRRGGAARRTCRRPRGRDVRGRRGGSGARRAGRWTATTTTACAREPGTACRNRRGWPTDGDPKGGPWIRADAAPCTTGGVRWTGVMRDARIVVSC